MAQKSGLTIRQHQREELSLRAEFVVSEAHREQLKFTPMSSAAEPHVTQGLAHDISSGGVGLICPQFVPRMAEGSVRIYHPKPVGASGDGTPIYEICFEHAVKVRRVTLDSHEPTYALGLAFIDPDPTIEERVNVVLGLVPSVAGEENGDG